MGNKPKSDVRWTVATRSMGVMEVMAFMGA
jgi:hypothetical protein